MDTVYNVPLDHAQRSSFGSRTRMSAMCHLTMLNSQASTHSLCQKVDQLQSHITLVTSKDTERIAGNMWDTGRDVWNVVVLSRGRSALEELTAMERCFWFKRRHAITCALWVAVHGVPALIRKCIQHLFFLNPPWTRTVRGGESM